MKISVYVCVPTGKDVSDRWYNEVNQYNFNQPGFSSATGKSIYSSGAPWDPLACKVYFQVLSNTPEPAS